MSGRIWIGLGSLLAAVGIFAGAVGEHVLKNAAPGNIRDFEIATRYLLYHALSMAICGLFVSLRPGRLPHLAAAGFLVGIVLFCGGIYASLASDVRGIQKIVPVGGTIWIISWIVLAIGAFNPPPLSDDR